MRDKFKNKKIIVCDIDGTLANSDVEVDPEMLKIISRLQESHTFVTIGNGNYLHLYNQFIKKYIEEVGKEIYVYPMGGLECHKITKEGILKLYSNELTNEEKYKIVRAISDLIKENNIVPDTLDQIEDRGSMIVFSVLGRKADKELKKNYDPNGEKRKKFIEEYFKEKLPEFEMKIGGTTTIDFTKKGYTKAFGIKKIKEMFNCEFEDIIFFGDNLGEHGNDFPVKEFVDVIEVRSPEDTKEELRKLLFKEEIIEVPKPWGKEIWMSNNEFYCGKKLYINKGKRTSLHFHKNKHESFYIEKGRVLLEIENEKRLMKEGDTIRIPRNTHHRINALDDSVIIEISTHHEDSDYHRIELDNNIPQEMIERYADNIIVATSGYFDPIHIGHIEYLELAKKLGDKLIVIINNDKQTNAKKGYTFMPHDERARVIKELVQVDDVFISIDDDNSVCKSLEAIKPHIFAKGGDRYSHEIPEKKVCDELGIKIIDGLGDKIQSSSNLVKNAKVMAESKGLEWQS